LLIGVAERRQRRNHRDRKPGSSAGRAVSPDTNAQIRLACLTRHVYHSWDAAKVCFIRLEGWPRQPGEVPADSAPLRSALRLMRQPLAASGKRVRGAGEGETFSATRQGRRALDKPRDGLALGQDAPARQGRPAGRKRLARDLPLPHKPSLMLSAGRIYPRSAGMRGSGRKT
jgi:hypothetical protein